MQTAIHAKMFWIGLFLLAILTGFGCSAENGIDPIQSGELDRTSGMSASHNCWGLYEFICDPGAGTMDIIPLRGAYMHLNALPFLEPPALVNLSLESLEFNGNIIDADIGLRHPFLGLDEFTGFDVSGIVISNGSYSGYTDSDITIAGPGDFYLINADGHARWWNPDEFPVNEGTMFSYNDGLLGAPDDFADFSSTINGYKYFTDGLNPDDPVTLMDPAIRGKFSAGQKNIRHYSMDMGTSGLIFNYAIDACWMFPSGDYPWVAPDDFPPGANRVEPSIIDVAETMNTLWHDGTNWGGQLALDIDVYDWFDLEQDWLRIECPGAFTMVELMSPTGGGAEYSTFHADFTTVTPSSSDDLMILITAFCEDDGFQGFVPGQTTAAYKVHYAAVSDEPAGPPPTAVADSIPLIGFVDFAGDFYGDDSTGEITLYEWDFEGDGIYDWSSGTTGNTTHAYTEEGEYEATLRVSNGGGFTTDVVDIRMIDPLPIISNGNVWDQTWDDWTILTGGRGVITNTIEDDSTFKNYVRFHRTGSGNDGGQSRAVQDLNIDVSEYDHLYFSIFLKLITQACPGDGWWGQYGGWGDFPMHFWIFYDNQNDEPSMVHYGFIKDDATPQYNYVWEWDTAAFHTYHPESTYYKYESYVPLNTWQERKTIDLMSLGVDAPKHLTQIWIWTTGWDFETNWILPWFSDH